MEKRKVDGKINGEVCKDLCKRRKVSSDRLLKFVRAPVD